MNHYPKHVGDFLRKTLGLTMLQDGAYNRALDLYYAEEKPLPLKPETYLSLRCQSPADRAAVDFILARYFTETPEGYRHGRCDEEIEAYRRRAETARNNGSHGGRPRNPQETQSVNSGIANDNRNETGTKTNHEPVTITPSLRSGVRATLDEPTDEHRQIAAAQGVHCDEEFAKYRDWLSSTGKKTKDHHARFRLWLRTAGGFKARDAPKVTAADRRMDTADKIFARGKYAATSTDERDITSTAERVD